MALTKADLIHLLVDQYHFNNKLAKAYVDTFFELIISGIQQDGCVKISGFGKFSTRKKHSRPGRNPKTGEFAKIKARKVVTFKAGQKLKDIIEGSLETNLIDSFDD